MTGRFRHGDSAAPRAERREFDFHRPAETWAALCARFFLRREDRVEKRRCVWSGGRFSRQPDYNFENSQHSVTAATGPRPLCPQTAAASTRIARFLTPAPSLLRAANPLVSKALYSR